MNSKLIQINSGFSLFDKKAQSEVLRARLRDVGVGGPSSKCFVVKLNQHFNQMPQ